MDIETVFSIKLREKLILDRRARSGVASCSASVAITSSKGIFNYFYIGAIFLSKQRVSTCYYGVSFFLDSCANARIAKFTCNSTPFGKIDSSKAKWG